MEIGISCNLQHHTEISCDQGRQHQCVSQVSVFDSVRTDLHVPAKKNVVLPVVPDGLGSPYLTDTGCMARSRMWRLARG